jgi:hypothetical protein
MAQMCVESSTKRSKAASTYSRLLDGILQAEILANEARSNMFKRLSTRVKNDLE